MIVWPILALLFTGLETLALWKDRRRWEMVTKPAVILCLILWLSASTGLQGSTLWFGLGLFFSLLGDILLLFPHDRMFLAGLAIFLLTHVCYILGFWEQLFNLSAWTLLLLFLILLNGVRLLRRIAVAMRAKGMGRLVYPVMVYGLLVSLMLYAAMSTISDPDWEMGAAFLVSVGAFLFWISDLILAWNKFVSPFRHAHIYNSLTYHLGQIGLIAGVIRHFG